MLLRRLRLAVAFGSIAALSLLQTSAESRQPAAAIEVSESESTTWTAADEFVAATPVASAGATARAGSRGPRGVPGNWKLKFADGFNGSSLNLKKWRPNWKGHTDTSITKPFNRRELSCYDPKQVAVLDGSLRLTAAKRVCRTATGQTYDYASGIVQSSHDFEFSYGFAEARIYLPRNKNPALGKVGSCAPNWAAFWLDGRTWPVDGEIDVMECLGQDNVAWVYHWSKGQAGGSPPAWHGKMPGKTSWHTFGVDWKPGSLTYYFDGVKVGTHRRGVTGSPHFLIANLSISGTKIKVPQTVRIDYIRVWQR